MAMQGVPFSYRDKSGLSPSRCYNFFCVIASCHPIPVDVTRCEGERMNGRVNDRGLPHLPM
jgi:hypothetical protein